MKSLLRVLLLLLPTVASAQSQLAPCPSNPSVHWHNCFGSYTFADGNRYVGEWRNNNRNGMGTFTWADGARYVGQYLNGDRHGFGTMTWPDGNQYVGEYRANERNGQGTFTFPGGNRYVGEFRNGNYNGQGAFFWADGDRYVGEFREDERAGLGIFYGADGSIKQSGEWTNGNLTRSFAIDRSRFPFVGPSQVAAPRTAPSAIAETISLPACPATGVKHNCFGTSVFANQTYVGEFRNDKPNGRGTRSFSNGAIYVGEEKDGLKHGQGTYTWPDGNKYVGGHRDDKRDGQGTHTWPDGAKYVGEYRDDKMSGQGTYTWPDGAKYVGEWRDDKRNGQGIQYRPDGTINRSGIWTDGNLTQSLALDRNRFPFGGPSQAAGPPADTGRAERDRLAAEAEAARSRQRELEAQLEAERKRRVDAESRGRGQVSSTGTGFSVAPGMLVTNQHVVAGCRSIEVVSNDGRRAARVVDSDELVDLAILRVTGLGGGVAPIRKVGSVRLGEQAYSFGFPLSGLLSDSGNFTAGTVSSLRGMRDSASQIQISTPVQPGNSGGALADASGSVIGVVVGKLNASAIARATGDIPQNVNFAVSLQALSDFLGRNNVSVRTVDRGAALDTAQLADLMRGFTHRIECLGQPAAAGRSSPGVTTEGQAGNDTTVVLKNQSRQTIFKIFVSPQSSRAWGSDLLGTSVLSAGRDFTLKPPASQGCIFDVRVEYAGGRNEQKERQDFCSLVELVFTGN